MGDLYGNMKGILGVWKVAHMGACQKITHLACLGRCSAPRRASRRRGFPRGLEFRV